MAPIFQLYNAGRAFKNLITRLSNSSFELLPNVFLSTSNSPHKLRKLSCSGISLLVLAYSRLISYSVTCHVVRRLLSSTMWSATVYPVSPPLTLHLYILLHTAVNALDLFFFQTAR